MPDIDPAVAKLARQITELERRMRDMERSSRLERASVVVDAAGTALDVRQALVESKQASLAFAQALLSLSPAEFVGTFSVYFGNQAPLSPFDGDLWFNRDTMLLVRYAGGPAVAVDRPDLNTAFVGVDVALQTADGLIFTWWQATTPGAGNFGDLWFKSDANNAPYRWDDALGWTPLILAVIQSGNYVPGAGGFSTSEDGDAQFNDLQVVGSLGASMVTADDVQLAGRSLVGRLADKPEGVVKIAYKGGAGLTAAGPVAGTELRTFELNLGPLMAGHTYRTTVAGHFQRSVADDVFVFRLRYTTDGSEALATSAVLPGGVHQIVLDQNQDFDIWTDIEPAVTANYRIALTLVRAVGTGTGTIFLGEEGRRFRWLTEDLGLTEGALDQAALSQKLKADGSGADNPPISTFTKTFTASWGMSYTQANGSTATARTPNSELWQGFFSSDPEDDNSGLPFHYADFTLLGFDSTAVQAALSTATSISACKINYRLRRRIAATGVDSRFGTHDYASYPGATIQPPDPNAVSPRVFWLSTTKLNQVPNTSYAVDLGATVGGQFKTGARKGVAIISQDCEIDGNGSHQGMGTAYVPTLSITYQGTS